MQASTFLTLPMCIRLGKANAAAGNLMRQFRVSDQNVIIATKVNGELSKDINDREHIA